MPSCNRTSNQLHKNKIAHTARDQIKLASNASAPSLPVPIFVNWNCFGGTQLTYEAAEYFLLEAGLLLPAELPGLKKGCHRKTGRVHASRLKDGRVRLAIHADEAATRATAFKRFLGGILSDTRLSLLDDELSA